MEIVKVKGLQPVWDRRIIDEEKTTAEFTVGTPVKREIVFVPDAPWETNMAHYHNVVKDGDTYKMYYISHYDVAPKLENEGKSKGSTIEILNLFVCYAESKDGLHWVKPNLGICEWNGSKENNIILRSVDKPEEGGFFDNFFVFIDTNPNCPPEKRFKATAYHNYYRLAGWVSPDGIRWKLDTVFDLEGKFDSLNVCWWDERIQKYVMYIRDFHDIPENGDLNKGIRDARRTESEDFVKWSTPELVKFVGSEDYPIYTNQISRYYRNPDIYIGFPTRYEERPAWNDSFEQLCGKEFRREVMKQCPRYGLTVTDCVFMSSRDGSHFDKCDEALFTPGYEFEANWIYGNGYPAYFMLETPSDDGENTELSLFVAEGYSHNNRKNPDTLYRYTIRRDGFACYKAKYTGGKVVTKPFIFDGDELRLNFSTSAKGYVFITIIDVETGKTARTCELFGDKDDRLVHFENAEVSEFAGKKVTLTFDMRDSKIYAFEFRKTNAK